MRLFGVTVLLLVILSGRSNAQNVEYQLSGLKHYPDAVGASFYSRLDYIKER